MPSLKTQQKIEHPIIMSGNHPKLVLDGIKTMTRRVIKPQPDLLYSIYGDIIQLYHNRRAEDDRVDIKTDTNFPKRHLYGWERWQDILTNKIQGFWEEGFRGVVSIRRLQDREEGVFSCLLMPQQQEGNDVSSSVNMYGFSRDASSKVNAGEAFGWQPAKQQALQSQVGNSIRELARQDTPQQKQSELQQSEFTDNASRERTYPLGSKEQNRQQETYRNSLRDKPTFYIRNMPFSVGSRLWVRETFKYIDFCLLDMGELHPRVKVEYKADGIQGWVNGDASTQITIPDKWRPSIFMPRWASRITLEITDIRVERVQEITEDDAISEGAIVKHSEEIEGESGYSFRLGFIDLWDSLNAKRGFGWSDNPWVWVITFKKEG